MNPIRHVSTDDILKKASCMLMKEMYSDLSNGEEIHDEEIKNLELKIRNSIKNQKICKNNKSHILRRVAIIIIVLIVISSAAMSVKAIREAVFDFFVEIYEKYLVAYYVPTSDDEELSAVPEIIEQYFAPTYIPEGYNLSYEDAWYRSYSVKYINQDSSIFYEQRCLGATYAFDTESPDYQTINIEGMTVYISEVNDCCNAYWSNNGYEFRIESNISSEEVEKIIKSIKIIPDIVTE